MKFSVESDDKKRGSNGVVRIRFQHFLELRSEVMRMRLIGVAVLAGLLMAGQAMAVDSNDDKSAAPVKWTGPYVGVNFGGSWSSNTPGLSPASEGFKPVFHANDVSTRGAAPPGRFGGLQAGYIIRFVHSGLSGLKQTPSGLV
jgi:hypothetical protein